MTTRITITNSGGSHKISVRKVFIGEQSVDVQDAVILAPEGSVEMLLWQDHKVVIEEHNDST